jgi:hypothetical protein
VPARATVLLPVECNNACIFCGVAAATGETEKSPAREGPSVSEQLAAARVYADEVTFVGGEPTLDPALADHVALARSTGFAKVGVQTNARGLGPALPSLVAAGLTDLHLSIHGPEAAIHDYHTGFPGSFDLVLGALGAARARGVGVVVVTVLTRSNFRSLGPMPRLLSSRGVAGWLVSVPAVAGRTRAAFDRVVPRLGLALPFALSALDAGEALGLEVRIAGAPRCMLGPYARWTLPEAARFFAEGCEGCLARSTCVGLDAAYLARFGGDEVEVGRERLEAGRAEPPRETAVSRQFVGAGELALGPIPEPVPMPAPRVSLPIAGKTRPAHGEVTSGAPRQSGEALRAILPDLFQEDGRKG